jgi:hypothetical protein
MANYSRIGFIAPLVWITKINAEAFQENPLSAPVLKRLFSAQGKAGAAPRPSALF